ncbi:MAG: DNA polymerase IV, partial [Clostridia bacterium]|nr:DNA polymerase IV [Clostridia bacterium]
TVITEANFREILWPLPVSEMLFVGKSASARLNRAGIQTIGDLANAPESRLSELLGKSGLSLRRMCNGLDDSPVRLYDDRPESKSVSHGTTFRRDLTAESEIRSGITMLSDEVARRLRKENLKGTGIQISLKTPDLKAISRQTTLCHATFSQKEIAEGAMRLVKANWQPGTPIRAITVGVTRLAPANEIAEQISLFDLCEAQPDSFENREKREKLEKTIDQIRLKHGKTAIQRAARVETEEN